MFSILTYTINRVKLIAGGISLQVVDPINKLIDTVEFDAVFYSLDWHPADHVSFIDNIKVFRQIINLKYQGKTCSFFLYVKQRPIHPTSPVSRYQVRFVKVSLNNRHTPFDFNSITLWELHDDCIINPHWAGVMWWLLQCQRANVSIYDALATMHGHSNILEIMCKWLTPSVDCVHALLKY